MIKDDLLSFISVSAELEECAARLYLYYSKIFREDASFWLELYIEEKMHAATFNIFLDEQFPIDLFPLQLVDRSLESIRGNVRLLDNILVTFNNLQPSKREAYEFALEVELLASEKLYQETITMENATGVLLLMQRINKDSCDHHTRILDFIKSIVW